MKILSVFGTRPEAIKMAPVIRMLKNTDGIDCSICVTAQHREMLDQILELFKITPDIDLNLMQKNQNLETLTINILKEMPEIIKKENPDYVLIQGDTTTTMTTALSAFYQKIPVAHIEAGLRTGNIYSPWPEEMNRKLVSSIASLHFAPTKRAKKALLKESIAESNIVLTGNTVIDALLETLKQINFNPDLQNQLEKQFQFIDTSKRIILVTGHRRENFGKGFENICHALEMLSKREDIQIVYPVHLNPNVQEPVKRILDNSPNMHLIEPLDYLPFVYLMDKSYLIITDSGGIQEEAPAIGKPVLVMREETERQEAIEAGTAKLVGTNKEKIIQEVNKLLDNQSEYQTMGKAHNPFGDGNASEIIVNSLLKQP